jgi:hypothetical protein
MEIQNYTDSVTLLISRTQLALMTVVLKSVMLFESYENTHT